MASALALAVSMAMCPASLGAVRDGDALVVIGSIGNAEGRDRGLFVTLPALALAQY